MASWPSAAFGENALVRFDGSQEEIVLSVAIQGQSKTAAWIMPVPAAAQVWEIVAVKLAPREASAQLSGATPPLRLTFASSRIVYPMRLSKGATPRRR